MDSTHVDGVLATIVVIDFEHGEFEGLVLVCDLVNRRGSEVRADIIDPKLGCDRLRCLFVITREHTDLYAFVVEVTNHLRRFQSWFIMKGDHARNPLLCPDEHDGLTV